MSTFIQKRWVQITFLVVLALALRLFSLFTPLADWHSFRQVDTASVAYEYYQALQTQGWTGLDLLRPRYQDLSNSQSGLPNPEGWRMVEFPIVNGLVASIMYLTHSDNVVVIYRLVDIFFSLLSVAGIYLLLEKLSHRRLIAFLGAFFLATLPYAVFYSRTILPEVALITGQIYTLLFFYDYLAAKKIWPKIIYFFLTLVTLALALLIKPVTVFLAPVLLYLAFVKYKNQIWKQWPLYLLAILAVLPLLGWRYWITFFPAGVPASDWLLQGSVKAFSLTWFRWLLVERSLKLILGLFGTTIALGALVKRSQRTPIKQMTAFDGFCLVYAFGAALFLIIFATGNIQHDYYQNFILPVAVVLLAKGTAWLFDRLPKTNHQFSQLFRQPLTWIFILAAIALQIFFFWLVNDQNEINLGQTIGWRFYLLIAILAALLVFFIFSDQIILRLKKFTWSKFVAPAFSLFILIGLVGDYWWLWDKVSSLYHINHWAIVAAGAAADEILPEDALVIAPYQTDTTFLFQTRRRGWAASFEIPEKIAQGAQYYLTVNHDDEAQELQATYQTLLDTPNYLLLDLTQPLSTSAGELAAPIINN